MNLGNLLLKLIKSVLVLINAACDVSDEMEKNKVPVCGAYEAYSRRERGEISRENFIDATRF